MLGRIVYAVVLSLLAISPWVAHAEGEPTRSMVVYVFHDTGLEYQQNLKFFLKFGIQADVDYYIVVNGPSLLPISVEGTPNVHVLRRENYGYDFQAWGTALSYAMQQKAYTHFLFMNGSLRGPYTKSWLQKFLQPLSETVKAVGLSLNCPDWFDRPVVHIQSMLWATDLVGLNVLLDGGLLSTVSKEEAYNGESQIGLLLRDAGFQITSMQNIHLGLPPPASLVQCDRDYKEIWSVSPLNDLPNTAVFPFIKTKYLPYRSAILVSQTAALSASSLRLAELAFALQKMGILVEVAAPSSGPLTEALDDHGVPCHKLNSLTPSEQAAEVRKLHVDIPYAIAIWNGEEYSLPSVASATPGAQTTIWVHGGVQDTHLAALQQFQFVWFADSKAATAASSSLYPRGHAPLGFRIVPGLMASLPADDSAAVAPRNAQTTSTLAALVAAARGDTAAAHQVSSLALAMCPATAEAKVAVAVHLGAHDPNLLQSLLEAFRSFPVHIWVTHFDRSQSSAIQSLADVAGLQVFPMLIRDKGLDVGPFFLTLAQMQACDFHYTYLLKYHYQTGAGFMQSHAHQMLAHATMEQAIAAFDKNPQLALAYPGDHSSVDKVAAASSRSGMANAEWIGQISAELKLPPEGFPVSGSIWMVRASMLLRSLKDVPTIMTQYSRFIEKDSIDWRWYSRNIRASASQVEALTHYLQVGQPMGLPGHCYAPGWVGNHDGMVEHAWQRLFGAMLSTEGDQFAMLLHNDAQQSLVEKLTFHTQATLGDNISTPIAPTSDTTFPGTAISFTASLTVNVGITVSFTATTAQTLTGSGTSGTIVNAGTLIFSSPDTQLTGPLIVLLSSGGKTSNTNPVTFSGDSSCTMTSGHTWTLSASLTILSTSASKLTMDITGTFSGTALFSVKRGRVKCRSLCKLLVRMALGGLVSRLSGHRQLLQATVGTSGTIEGCGTVSSGSFVFSSGGLWSADTSCVYSTTIASSAGGTVSPVSVSTDTTTSSPVTFESGSTFSLQNVSSSSGLVNINGMLTMASGSTLQTVLRSTATSAFTVKLIRYETSSCVVPASASKSISDCGSFTCTYTAAAESSTWCIVSLAVTQSSSSSSSDNNGLYGLLALLAIIPLALGCGVLAWFLLRDKGEAGLATQYTYNAAEYPKAENWTPAPTPLGRF